MLLQQTRRENLIKIDQKRINKSLARMLVKGCPFDAMTIDPSGTLTINEKCRMCRICLKLDTNGALYEQRATAMSGKESGAEWNGGIFVIAEFIGGRLHPVTLELLGKARELVNGRERVCAVLPGFMTSEAAKSLAYSGADSVLVYDDARLANFDPMRFAACAEDCIVREKPAVVMIGATMAGRSLAPRLAARLHTGLTADCTALSLNERGELLQTRPAFGGNVMAEILTKHARPQMCTVRYRVFAPLKVPSKRPGEIVFMPLPDLDIGTEIVAVSDILSDKDLSDAQAIVALGRGCVGTKNIEYAKELATLLNAQLGCTRPMVENGVFDVKKQIGLSGRTVRPKYLIALGISGSVQFAAGINGTEFIIAVNSDPTAPIFQIAHVGLCCDVNEVLPRIIARIKAERGTQR